MQLAANGGEDCILHAPCKFIGMVAEDQKSWNTVSTERI